MPSSRATTAAATSPPRVTQTIASNGPAPLRRQASARESRWNWSHETGKNFSGRTCCGCTVIPEFSSRGVEHEIALRREATLGLGDAHQQVLAKQAVGAVLGLARKVELGGEHAAARRLDLDVEVARAPRIGTGHDRAKAITARGIGVLVAAQPEALVVVVALLVGLPEVDQGARHRPAVSGQHHARELDQLPARARLAQVATLG